MCPCNNPTGRCRPNVLQPPRNPFTGERRVSLAVYQSTRRFPTHIICCRLAGHGLDLTNRSQIHAFITIRIQNFRTCHRVTSDCSVISGCRVTVSTTDLIKKFNESESFDRFPRNFLAIAQFNYDSEKHTGKPRPPYFPFMATVTVLFSKFPQGPQHIRSLELSRT